MNNSISLDISKEVQSDRRIVRDTQEYIQEHQLNDKLQKQQTLHALKNINSKNLGSMIIISKRFNLSVGPNYFPFCLGFIMVLVMGLLLNYCTFALVKNKQQNGSLSAAMRVISVVMAIWTDTTYLMTALSDPGVYSYGKINISENSRLSYCQQCDMKVPQKVRHCDKCKVCIIQLDHHCPWMSKCIGRNNLKPFYAFLGGLFLMVGVFWLTLFRILTI